MPRRTTPPVEDLMDLVGDLKIRVVNDLPEGTIVCSNTTRRAIVAAFAEYVTQRTALQGER